MSLEIQLDHWWDIHGKPSLLEFMKNGESTNNMKNHITCKTPDSVRIDSPGQFDLHAINWLDKARNQADFEAPWSWAFIYDQEGEIHPEIESLYNEVLRYSEVHSDG